MRLGDFTDSLSAFPPTMLVTFDFGGSPGRLASWRGDYADLTLTHGGERMEVGTLLAFALDADGGTFTGYKGGEYEMNRRTPLWADDWGDYHRRMPTGFVVVDDMLVIRTRVDDEGYV